MKLLLEAKRYKLMYLFATYILKKQLLVYSFAACQKRRAAFKSYHVLSGLVYLYVTYALTINTWVNLLWPTKDSELLLQGSLKRRERS